MQVRRRWHGAWRFALALAVTPLSGCATFHLWGAQFPSGAPRDDRDLLIREERRQVATTTTEQAWALQGEGLLASGLWAIAPDGSVAHWLRPGPGADVAMALLADQELGVVGKATAACTRDHVAGEVEHSDLTLTLPVVLDEAAIATPIAITDLDPDVLRLLARPRWNAFLLAGDPDLHLPPAIAACVRRLGQLDLAKACREGIASAVVESYVVLDGLGRPCYVPGMRVPPGLDGELPLAERLQALAMHHLLVRVRTPSGERFLKLRADRVWLLSSLSRTAVHESQWVLEPPIAARVGRPAAPKLEVLVAARLEDRTFDLVRVETPKAESLWTRILLTPIAVSLDATVLLPVNVLALWLGDDVAPGGPGERPTRAR